MKIKLDDLDCKVCGQLFGNLRGVAQHVKKHNYTTIRYTMIELLHNNVPQCKCGCGADVIVKPFKYDEYRSGHNPDCFWQSKFDKNSDEYKEIISKISKSVSAYLSDNPRTVTEEGRKNISIKMKNWIENNPDSFAEKIEKMTKTKQIQSENGILSDRHWINNWDEDRLDEKLKKMGEKSSATKKNKFKTGDLVVWNKGLTANSDDRMSKISGENNYRYSGNNKNVKYDRTFRNKQLRKKLLDRQNGKCFICDKNNTQLCLHHVNENKNDNDENNLIFLCRSCHIRVHNVPILMENLMTSVVNFKSKIKS